MGNILIFALKVILSVLSILFIIGVYQALKDSNKKHKLHH